MVNFLSLEEGETISTTLAVDDFNSSKYLFMVTKKGMVKKTPLLAYSHPQKRGIIGINLKDEDKLIKVLLTEGDQDILLATKQGKAVHFSEEDVRPTGRVSRGVKGISLREGDEVKDAVVIEKDGTLLTITSHGYGKRTFFKKYRKTRRGGKGIINIRLSLHKGEVIGIKKIEGEEKEEEEIIVITQKGKSIRLAVKNISIMGRSTSGLRIIRLGEDDKAIALT